MDDYTPMYCAACSQLRWREHVNRACEFCGSTIFASVRPTPTFSAIDRRFLHRLEIPGTNVMKPKDKKS